MKTALTSYLRKTKKNDYSIVYFSNHSLCSCLIFTDSVWYGKKHGMKYTLTGGSFTAEWDFSSPLTMLKLTRLFIQGEDNQEKRNKYIRQYNRLRESLKDKYDMSDFPDYKE